MRQLTATKWQMTAQRSNIAGIWCLCHSAQFSKNEKPAVSNIETTSWCRIVSAAREKDDHIWAFLCQHKSSGRSKWCGWYHGKCYTNCTHVIAIANLEKTSASDFALSILADSDVHVVVNPEPHPKASCRGDLVARFVSCLCLFLFQYKTLVPCPRSRALYDLFWPTYA